LAAAAAAGARLDAFAQPPFRLQPELAGDIRKEDGENYNIGFLDICNRAYDELGQAAIASHERIYEVADGRVPPFRERLEYLPKLYL
jgi:hypothetical protein